MTDANGYITQETDPEDWEVLNRQWLSEHKPGYVLRGNTHYSVVIINDIPKFKILVNKNLYESTSFGA